MTVMIHEFSPVSGHAVAIGADAHMSQVIDLFRSHPHLRALAVLNADKHPVGIIREQRVRELLFCPFWFSLMQNPTIGGSIASMIEPCPTADVARSTADLLRIAAQSRGQGELILTDGGRFVETLDSGQLARLAMLRDVELAQEHAARGVKVDDAGRAFQQDITALTAGLSDMARRVEQVAGSCPNGPVKRGAMRSPSPARPHRRWRVCANSAIAVTRWPLR